MIDPRGYVLIRVGIGHPLADVRGYAYEHRLIAQGYTARPLTRRDHVHHDNEKKGDNGPDNLEVTSPRRHRALHRRPSSKLRLPGQANRMVRCTCGCGASFRRFDEIGRPRRFLPGHNPQPSPTLDQILMALYPPGTVKRVAAIAIEVGKSKGRISTAMQHLVRRGQVYSPHRGEWQLNPDLQWRLR